MTHPHKERPPRSFWVWALLGVFLIGGGLASRHDLDELRRAERNALTARERALNELRRENRDLVRTRALSVEADVPAARATASEAQLGTERSIRMNALVDVAEVLNASGRLTSMARTFADAGVVYPFRQNQPTPAELAAQAGAFLLTSSGRLPPRFGELFGLAAGEVEQLDRVLAETRTALEQQILANGAKLLQADGSLIIDVPALPEAVVAMHRDRVTAAFRNILGDQGYRALQLLNGRRDESGAWTGGIENLFGAFGQKAQSLQIVHQGGRYHYQTIRSNPDRPTTEQRGAVAVGLSGGLASAIGPAAVLVPLEF
jgi:hypothetical protein